MKKILRELDHGAKESCWAWYIFPTEKAGMCDFDGTRITKDNAVDLCNNESTAMDWQKCLEKICDLLEARRGFGFTWEIGSAEAIWFCYSVLVLLVECNCVG